MATAGKYPTALLALADVGGEMANFPEAVLSGAHNNSVTTITLTATAPAAWPTAGSVTIDSEIIAYTGKSGSTLTGCTRASQSTTAASHSDQAKVGLYLTAAQWNQVVADLIATQTKIGTGASTPSGTTNVLTATGTGTSAWAAPSSGAMTQIAQTLLVGTATSINFASIASTYNHLRIELQVRFDAAAAANAFLRFNNDSAANYDEEILYASDAGATSMVSALGSSLARFMIGCPGTNTPAGNAGVATIDILNYKNTTFYKQFVCSFHTVADAGPNLFVGQAMGTWKSTAAINRVELFPPSGNFIIGCIATLYGLT